MVWCGVEELPCTIRCDAGFGVKIACPVRGTAISTGGDPRSVLAAANGSDAILVQILFYFGGFGSTRKKV